MVVTCISLNIFNLLNILRHLQLQKHKFIADTPLCATLKGL